MPNSSLPIPGRSNRRASEHGSNQSLSFARSPQRDYISFGSVGRPGVFLPSSLPRRSSLVGSMSLEERQELLNQEQELLADNKLMNPPTRKAPLPHMMPIRRPSSSNPNNSYGTVPTQLRSSSGGDINSERSNLLVPSISNQSVDSTLYPLSLQKTIEENENLVRETWTDAISKGEINTTYKRETVVLFQSSIPISLAFLLQYSLTVASIFCVGHIGKKELSAVSVAAMIANIFGYGIFQGLATSLDTLATQAYGRKDYEVVGIHTQQCVMQMFLCAVPIAMVWWFSEYIFRYLVDDESLATLASHYLRVLMLGMPGYIVFEVSKHYLQAQGIFHASTYVLIICAPFNLVLNYVLVWNKHIGLGFIGAPIAVITTDYLMATLSILYVKYIDGMECWHGFSKNSFKNWGHMAYLGFSGVLALETEWLAFELLTLAAARLGTTELASQTVLATVAVLGYQIPLSMGISASTRVGNLLGAQLPKAAQIASRTYIVSSVFFGAFNGLFMFFTRHYIGRLFSSDPDVIAMVADVTPIVALYQINDGISAVTGGVLRGQGRQSISGWTNLALYYGIALPLGLYLAFNKGMKLFGIWIGIVFALFFVCLLQIFFVRISDWTEITRKALENDYDDEDEDDDADI